MADLFKGVATALPDNPFEGVATPVGLSLDDVAKTNDVYLSALEAPNTLDSDEESHARQKLRTWYKIHRGDDLDDANLESRFKADFGDTSSYGAAVESLTNLYRMVPKGPSKSAPKMRAAGDRASLFVRSMGTGFTDASNNGIFGTAVAAMGRYAKGAKWTGKAVEIADMVSGIWGAVDNNSDVVQGYKRLREQMPKDMPERAEECLPRSLPKQERCPRMLMQTPSFGGGCSEFLRKI